MKGFINFVRSRGIVGFAIGFILGKATSDLVGSFVNDIINPIIGLATNRFGDLSQMSFDIATATVKYGSFLSFVINFLILAIVVYVIFKVLKIEELDKKD